ncbi:cobalamin/vitamin B12 biosynthesis CbiM protein [Candidatus Vecturithrix granuli]|uniref:Cobalamin/vitamin B12 biosynthesis CbiM protein n=1 Tax=Vecturithrix granuli TaxID=1499967 RepID=A0A081BTM9_VECG1|nr:cobalamin/vitamin B12 biosynthesis CbiM protein [Candidatus Vecturithrix granuli]
MHMADALLSPAVGGTMWAATATLIGYSTKKVQQTLDDSTTPLMGVLGAFIFAAQMINFTIPATGSSGHLGGGMILAILLGPPAAFLTMASVLTIQSLFFADGGLLALGCNIFNLGFFPCFLVYPLIYQKIAGNHPTRGRIVTGSVISAIIGLQLGAFGVVLETMFSGISELPFTQFVLLMQPIHLAIGVVEGLATAAVIMFIWQARPELLERATPGAGVKRFAIKPVLVGLIAATILTAGILSWFASAHPDGLEWAMFHTAGTEELETPENSIYSSLATIQEKTAILPDYSFKKPETQTEEKSETWPAVDPGTSVSGLVGGAVVFLIAMGIGFGLKGKKSGAMS